VSSRIKEAAVRSAFRADGRFAFHSGRTNILVPTAPLADDLPVSSRHERPVYPVTSHRCRDAVQEPLWVVRVNGNFSNRPFLSHIAERNRATSLADLLCDGDFQVVCQLHSAQPPSSWFQKSIPSDKTVLNCRPLNDEDAKFMSTT